MKPAARRRYGQELTSQDVWRRIAERGMNADNYKVGDFDRVREEMAREIIEDTGPVMIEVTRELYKHLDGLGLLEEEDDDV